MLIFFIASRQHVVQSRRLAMVQARWGAVDTEQARRVVLRPQVLRGIVRAGPDIVQLEGLLQAAVRVIGATVAVGATDFLAEKQHFAPFGRGGESARLRAMRR